MYLLPKLECAIKSVFLQLIQKRTKLIPQSSKDIKSLKKSVLNETIVAI